MKFRLGVPPKAPGQVASESWQPVKIPGPLVLNILGVPLGILMAFLLMLGWTAWTPMTEFRLVFQGIGDLVLLMTGIVFFIMIHELLHCLGHPGFGLSSLSIIGLVPSQHNPHGGQKTWLAETCNAKGELRREYLLCSPPPKRNLRDLARRIYRGNPDPWHATSAEVPNEYQESRVQ